MTEATTTPSASGAPAAAEHPSTHAAGHQPAGAADSSAAQPEENGWEWAIVEVFGHRKHAGRVREEERFGAKMLRIDIPLKGDPAAHGWQTHWYGGSSIFSLSLTDEATALRANKPYEPPSRYLPPPGDGSRSDDDFED